MSTYNNFEILLLVASEECCKKQAEEFLQVNDEGFEITDRQRKRMKQLIRKYSKKQKSKSSALTWKWIAIACLLSLSIALTACVSISELREAIKKFFLEWHEDFVAIGFGDNAPPTEYPDYETIMPGDQPSTGETPADTSDEDTTEETVTDPPTEILKKAYITYLPENYTYEIKVDTKYYYLVNYYLNENRIFSFTQNIIDDESYWTDNDTQTTYKTKINGNDAIVTERKEENNTYFIIWQDKEYKYTITGIFDNMEELIKVAESVKV